VVAPSRDPARRDAVRRGVEVAVLVGIVVVATAVVIAGTGPETGGLAVPDPGDVAAAELEDGTPVFVSRPQPSTVLVLDAASPWEEAAGDEAGGLLIYCRRTGQFEDLRVGTTFTPWGDWSSGPGPGMAAYPVVVDVEGTGGPTVRVTGPRGDHPAPRERRGPAPEPSGDRCIPGETPDDEVVAHRDVADLVDAD
jgi:hypothetical protein